MRRCPQCGKMSLTFNYECGVAVAWCAECEYLKAAWPYFEQAIKKMRRERKHKIKLGQVINFA